MYMDRDIAMLAHKVLGIPNRYGSVAPSGIIAGTNARAERKTVSGMKTFQCFALFIFTTSAIRFILRLILCNNIAGFCKL